MRNVDMEKFMKKYKRRLTRKSAIRIYCRELCSGGDLKSWRECTFIACPLFSFRFGRETIARGKSFKKGTQNVGILAKKGHSVEGIKPSDNHSNLASSNIQDKLSKEEQIKNT